MTSIVRWNALSGLLVCLVVLFAGRVVLADPPAAPKVSKFAPADDLVKQLDEYVEDLEEVVASKEKFTDSEGKLAKDSNALIVIALALGLHDVDNKYKASAGAVMEAAGQVAAAKDYASAKKAVAAVKAAVEAKGGGNAKLEWKKVASLEQLMKKVPLIHTRLKRYVKPRRFKRKAEDTAGYAAVLAVIAQGTLADTHEAKNPSQVKDWYTFSAGMRDAAAAVNAAIRAADQKATDKAMDNLAQTCDDCHAVFHEEGEKVTAGGGGN